MTDHATTPPAKRKPGRPAHHPDTHVQRSIRFSTDEVAHLEAVYGSVYAGVRELVRRECDPESTAPTNPQ